jgi:hypothetical protein
MTVNVQRRDENSLQGSWPVTVAEIFRLRKAAFQALMLSLRMTT